MNYDPDLIPNQLLGLPTLVIVPQTILNHRYRNCGEEKIGIPSSPMAPDSVVYHEREGRTAVRTGVRHCPGDPAAQRGPQSARFLRRQNQGSSIWARVGAPSDFAPRHSTVGAGTVGVALALSGKFALPFALVPAAQSWLRDMDCFPIQGIFTTSTCQMRILENFGSCPRNRTEGAGELSEASG